MYKDQIYSVASSLIASNLFAIVFNSLANRELTALLRQELNDTREELLRASHKISDDVVREINRNYTDHSPSRIYMPTTSIDSVFNTDLTQDLKHSSFYLFQGISAKYVPIRVMACRHTITELHVTILDPQDDRSVSLRARDRSQNPKYANVQLSELQASVRHEIYMSVIALFDCRIKCPVEIAYGLGTSVIRLEIFDEALYMSLYHTERAASLQFPETIRYNKLALLYNLFRLDASREFEIREKRVTFDSSSKEADLLEHLKQIGMPKPTSETINTLRTEFRKFSDSFINISKIDQL